MSATVAGGVDTVRTVAGSRWGTDGRLVEELPIGQESGDEPYLFGTITATWATDERIYVVDSQVPAVRAFDHRGKYLFDIGRVGEGPGEYRRPTVLAVSDDGRIFVTDVAGGRLNVYDAEGTPLESRSLGSSLAALGLLLDEDGELWTQMVEVPEDLGSSRLFLEPRSGMQRVGPDGLTGDPLFPPSTDFEPPKATVVAVGNELEMAIIPFTPRHRWALAPGGEMIAGVGDEYRFEIIHPDDVARVVEKSWSPVPVEGDEAAFRARVAAASVHDFAPDYRMDPDLVPTTKPAFTRFRPDRSGRVWVQRQGPGRRDPDCLLLEGAPSLTVALDSSGASEVSVGSSSDATDDLEDECWADTWLWDVFEIASGEFLGTVHAPEPGFRAPLFIEGETVLGAVQDALGTVRLKKYRLVTGR